MKTIDRAEAIQKAMDARNAIDAILDILLPEEIEDGCPHPAEALPLLQMRRRFRRPVSLHPR